MEDTLGSQLSPRSPDQVPSSDRHTLPSLYLRDEPIVPCHSELLNSQLTAHTGTVSTLQQAPCLQNRAGVPAASQQGSR
jgi:hypothetical protein